MHSAAKPALPTSHSLTSIAASPPHKLDALLDRLQGRRKELKEILAASATNALQDKTVGVGDGGKGRRGSEQAAGAAQRRRKYETKIEYQRVEYAALNGQLDSISSQLMAAVMEIEDCEMALKKISEQVGQLYREALGLEQPNCQGNRKWLHHRILDLETILAHSPMSMRAVLCQFYRQQNREECEQILWQIIRGRQVNKLYGFIIDREQGSQSGRLDEEEHESWLGILKCMKMLQKLQPCPPDPDPENTLTVDVEEFSKQMGKQLEQEKHLKGTIKQMRVKIKQMQDRKQEIQHEMKIKEEFMEQINKKIQLIDQETKQALMDENKNCNGQARGTGEGEKQLKEVEEAIKYFSIKKNTSLQAKQDSLSHFKSVEDMGTCFLSPQKSCSTLLTRNLSPRRKYTLAYLLSPPKLPLEKRKAWK